MLNMFNTCIVAVVITLVMFNCLLGDAEHRLDLAKDNEIRVLAAIRKDRKEGKQDVDNSWARVRKDARKEVQESSTTVTWLYGICFVMTGTTAIMIGAAVVIHKSKKDALSRNKYSTREGKMSSSERPDITLNLPADPWEVKLRKLADWSATRDHPITAREIASSIYFLLSETSVSCEEEDDKLDKWRESIQHKFCELTAEHDFQNDHCGLWFCYRCEDCGQAKYPELAMLDHAEKMKVIGERTQQEYEESRNL